MFFVKKQPLEYTSSLGVTKESTGGSTKPEIAFDANLSEQANAEASYALSEVAARK